MRSATTLEPGQSRIGRSFNPRTPCGVRRSMSNVMGTVIMFQSTHSLRSATPTGDVPLRFEAVSIHALLAECDLYQLALSGYNIGFNPRTPCGVRPCGYFSNKNPQWFQSTHSLRSATSCKSFFNKPYDVSIHALLAECDTRPCIMTGSCRVSIHALLAECDMTTS